MCVAADARAACPSGGLEVGAGKSYATLSAAVAAVPSSGSATVCVFTTSGASALCPGGNYVDNVLVDGARSIDFVAQSSGICVEGASYSLPAIEFDGAGASSLSGLERIVCGGPTSAVEVTASTVQLAGWAGAGIAPTRLRCGPGDAVGVHEDGVVVADDVVLEESLVGVRLDSSGGASAGGSFDASHVSVLDNGTGILASSSSTSSLTRSLFEGNPIIGVLSGTHAATWEDTGVVGNLAVGCGSGATASAGGLRLEDSATADLFNLLWTGNCTDSPPADLPLLHLTDSSEAEVQSNTFDANAVEWVIRLEPDATLLIQDSILADDAATWASGDGGIYCGNGSATLDEIAFWQLDGSMETWYCPTFTTRTSGIDPLFVTWASTCASSRDHLLDGSSPFVDASSRTSATVGLDGHMTEQPTASCVPPGSFVLDGGQLDLGFHWWAY